MCTLYLKLISVRINISNLVIHSWRSFLFWAHNVATKVWYMERKVTAHLMTSVLQNSVYKYSRWVEQYTLTSIFHRVIENGINHSNHGNLNYIYGMMPYSPWPNEVKRLLEKHNRTYYYRSGLRSTRCLQKTSKWKKVFFWEINGRKLWMWWTH
jgi:hypothetical protein